MMKPKKEDTESYTFRIPTALRQELQRQADEEERTLSNYITMILRQAVKKRERR